MRCLIVEDEKPALELLEDNVKKVPFLTLAGTCRNSFEALEVLRNQQIDLLFLDIRMPGISGLDLIRGLQHAPLIILVTAYDHHAVEAFQLNVVDYLLKPVSFERFFVAVNKAFDLFTLRKQSARTGLPRYDHIFVNAGYSLVKVRLEDIVYIEGLKDYVRINLCEGEEPVITRISLRELESKLPSDLFMRVHKSFIISLNRIDAVQKYKLQVSGHEIPIGGLYRDSLNSHINERNIQVKGLD